LSLNLVEFPVYLWIGSWQIHPHLFFESLAYAIAFRLVLLNSRKDTIAPTQRSSVIVGGMVGALVGAKVLVLLQHIDVIGLKLGAIAFTLTSGKNGSGCPVGWANWR
jgi:hypothetical protein